MSDLIRWRYNTMASLSPGGDWYWRVILEVEGGYREVLAKRLKVFPASFSRQDDMPYVGQKWHMACRGRFHLEDDGTGIISEA